MLADFAHREAVAHDPARAFEARAGAGIDRPAAAVIHSTIDDAKTHAEGDPPLPVRLPGGALQAMSNPRHTIERYLRCFPILCFP